MQKLVVPSSGSTISNAGCPRLTRPRSSERSWPVAPQFVEDDLFGFRSACVTKSPGPFADLDSELRQILRRQHHGDAHDYPRSPEHHALLSACRRFESMIAAAPFMANHQSDAPCHAICRRRCRLALTTGSASTTCSTTWSGRNADRLLLVQFHGHRHPSGGRRRGRRRNPSAIRAARRFRCP